MVAPSVLIVYDRDNNDDVRAANYVLKQLGKKYADEGYSFEMYWNPARYTRGKEDEERQKALAQAAHIIMLFSHSFVNKYRRQPELRLAVTRDPACEKGIIIPIYMENCDVLDVFNTPPPDIPYLFDLYRLKDDEILLDDISKSLSRVFREALAKWERHSKPVFPPLPVVLSAPPPAPLPASTALPSLTASRPQPFFTIPRYPDDSFFNAPSPNIYFMGEGYLTEIEQAYRKAQYAQPGSPHTLVLAGLRGSGKTHLAIHYAHRAYDDNHKLYQYVLWVKGGIGSTGSAEQLDEKVKPLLQELYQQGKITENRQDVESLKTWLQKNHKWLLIFDEVDDVRHIADYLPARGNGHVLVTTCSQIVNRVEKRTLAKMDEEDAILFLLNRATGIKYDMLSHIPLDEMQAAQKLVHILHCFPLAIEQQGGKIEDSMAGLVSYVENLIHAKVPLIELLRREKEAERNFTLTLVDLWREHLRLLREAYPVAADLLLLCAFFNPQGTYQKIITGGYDMLAPHFTTLPHPSLDDLVIQLRKYSLIERTGPRNEMLAVHPFLPAILFDELTPEQQHKQASRAFQAVHQACFLYSDDAELEEIRRWVPQLEVCERMIYRWQLQRPFEKSVQQLIERKIKWQIVLSP